MEKKRLSSQQDIYDFIQLLNITSVWQKLQDKTQVFNDRVVDAVKSRGSHSSDVGEIAAQLASGLTTNPVEIEKARLLGRLHDIGHIPFGHAGESIADKIIKDRYSEFSDEQKKAIEVIRKCLFGDKYAQKNTKPCFEHNENSVLQYYFLSEQLGFEVDPEIIEGILSHSTSRYPELPSTLVQQAVRLADKVAYINYDAQDLQLTFQGKVEWEALKKIYARPILDSDGKETIIEYEGKRYTNVLEFLEGLELSDRLTLFISEAVRMAQEDKSRNNDPRYTDYQTILTGGNDIVVAMSALKKNKQYYDKGKKEWTPEGKAEMKRLKSLLMEKSPILYLAYEMKERSDEFIRAGTGLPLEAQYERSKNARSAVGNDDLKNQYIYDKLVVFIENRDKIEMDEIPEKLQQVFKEFFQEYEEYKLRQESIIGGLAGNEQQFQYPEIYTILNFIGLHSNTDLIELSKHLGIGLMYEEEVLPELRALMDDEAMYDKETHLFTKVGIERRDKIVNRYGASKIFRYGMEEDDMTPTTSQIVIEKTRQYGYQDELSQENTKRQEVDKSENLQEFHQQQQKTEASYLNTVKEQIDLQVAKQIEGQERSHGR